MQGAGRLYEIAEDPDPDGIDAAQPADTPPENQESASTPQPAMATVAMSPAQAALDAPPAPIDASVSPGEEELKVWLWNMLVIAWKSGRKAIRCPAHKSNPLYRAEYCTAVGGRNYHSLTPQSVTSSRRPASYPSPGMTLMPWSPI